MDREICKGVKMNREEEFFMGLQKIGTAIQIENAANLLYSFKFITKDKRDYIITLSSQKSEEKSND